MVCAASSRGRRPPAKRSCRAENTPSSTPISIVSTVATSTVASVCMECCHRPSPDSPAVERARLEAVQDYAKEYKSYGGCPADLECSTKFIYKTDSIGE